MIFVNRRRIIQNSGIVKDPTKYWYIEKYVYGKLKETVEVPLGTGTTFGSIDSGYSDDTFYGWSISSTSTTKKFNATTKYKNTTTAVKNNLDDTNTLKIYAIYKYTIETNGTSSMGSDHATERSTIIKLEGTARFTGSVDYKKVYVSNGQGTNVDQSSSDLTIGDKDTYVKINNTNIFGKLGTISEHVKVGDIISIRGYGKANNNVTNGNGTAEYWNYYIRCDYPDIITTTKYRVDYHPPIYIPIN